MAVGTLRARVVFETHSSWSRVARILAWLLSKSVEHMVGTIRLEQVK